MLSPGVAAVWAHRACGWMGRVEWETKWLQVPVTPAGCRAKSPSATKQPKQNGNHPSLIDKTD